MKRALLVGMGAVLVLVTGCTDSGPPQASRTSPAPSSSPSPSTKAPVPPEPGPAKPLGGAAIGKQDGSLVESFTEFIEESSLDTRTEPALSEVAVLQRLGPPGTGDLVWMPDADTYCLTTIRSNVKGHQCHGLAPKRPARGYVQVGDPAPRSAGSTYAKQDWLLVSLVENAQGPFAFSGDRPKGASPVHQATLRFASGRTVTFLAYSQSDSRIPQNAEMCGPDRKVCFDPYDFDLGRVS
ncbi:hypothetical protein [Streptomyces fructofermentans]